MTRCTGFWWTLSRTRFLPLECRGRSLTGTPGLHERSRRRGGGVACVGTRGGCTRDGDRLGADRRQSGNDPGHRWRQDVWMVQKFPSRERHLTIRHQRCQMAATTRYRRRTGGADEKRDPVCTARVTRHYAASRCVHARGPRNQFGSSGLSRHSCLPARAGSRSPTDSLHRRASPPMPGIPLRRSWRKRSAAPRAVAQSPAAPAAPFPRVPRPDSGTCPYRPG